MDYPRVITYNRCHVHDSQDDWGYDNGEGTLCEIMNCHVCCCIAVETAVDIDERQVSLATAVVENHLTFARQVYNGRMDAWVHGDVILLYPAGRSRIHLIWKAQQNFTLFGHSCIAYVLSQMPGK